MSLLLSIVLLLRVDTIFCPCFCLILGIVSVTLLTLDAYLEGVTYLSWGLSNIAIGSSSTMLLLSHCTLSLSRLKNVDLVFSLFSFYFPFNLFSFFYF